ncbi:hypothetical protein THAOC_30712 [Thalassiosira oceanica]|uniref:Uncharacterized protein n=1 Tax=Thalassiosira oceanica TaxID=159749 RepID=K0RAU3_THAOC|nr:hypothetical protein THAOC_30712 [Thalassiosira oceanica]|eukprot:EJK50335.1 hypothetical protein THAOC_30712 [Thalassiosira oceanica]
MRLGRKKDTSTIEVDERDDMTMSSGTSGFSLGANSVSDRLMSKMKMNLGMTGGSSRNVNSSSSAGGSRRKLMSSGSFGGGSGRSFRSKSAGRFRPSSSPSPVGVGAMEDMDSSEAMALKGQTFGRRGRHERAPSAPPSRQSSYSNIFEDQRVSSQRKLGACAGGDEDGPVIELSLIEMRAMTENELEQVMKDAGVPEEDITNALIEETSHHSSESITDEIRKNALVSLFVKSGRLKLIRHSKSARALADYREASVSSINVGANGTGSERRMSALSVSTGLSEDTLRRGSSAYSAVGTIPANGNPDEIEMGDPAHRKSIDIGDSSRSTAKRGGVAPDQCKDEGSVRSSATKSTKDGSLRKSKMEKIAELKTANTAMKRENKSLKKTLKKLLSQMTVAKNDKDELQNELDAAKKDISETRQKLDEALTSLEDYKKKSTSQDDVASSSSPHPVEKSHRNSLDDSIAEESIRSIDKYNRRSTGERSVNSREDQSKSNSAYYKKKYKREREAHQGTEFRLKAELDILTKEVEGLQRELALSMESQEASKKRARDSKDAASLYKQELRKAKSKIQDLMTEAEARDKLIESFSQILLQRVGVEGAQLDEEKGMDVNDEVPSVQNLAIESELD